MPLIVTDGDSDMGLKKLNVWSLENLLFLVNPYGDLIMLSCVLLILLKSSAMYSTANAITLTMLISGYKSVDSHSSV